MNTKVVRMKKIFPWFNAFEMDLLFYVAVDTLFLTIVKNFSSAEVASLTAISTLASIILQFPMLWVIHKIGNTSSMRLGALLLFLSSVFITFAPSYWFVVIGKIFQNISAILESSGIVALENCLDDVGERQDFVKIRTKTCTIYATITMVISFVAGMMFNLNHYLPMFGCILAAFIGFVLSLSVEDYTKYNKISQRKKQKVAVRYDKLVILAIVVYGLFYPVVTAGQVEGKLFIQQILLLDLSLDNTSLLLTGIVCVSRVVRVISNVVFAKIYEKYQSKMGVAFTISLAFSLSLLLFGSFIGPFVVKVAVMGFGYVILLFIRDPFKLYSQDILFDYTPKEQHQTLLTLLAMGVKIGTSGTSFIFTLILLHFSMAYVMALSLFLALIEIALSVWLYSVVLKYKNEKVVETE